MSVRDGLRGIGLVGVALALGSCGLDELEIEVVEMDFGTQTTLEAVVTADYQGEDAHFAVGGTELVNEHGGRWTAPVALHGVAAIDFSRLVVVGEQGYVATAELGEGELELQPELVDTQADLWAVHVDHGLEVVVVGDEVLLVGREGELGERVWTEPPAPAGGWGRLRDIGSLQTRDGDWLCAVGEPGRVVCSVDDLDSWTASELGSEITLAGFCPPNWWVMVGEDGTSAIEDQDGGWKLRDKVPGVDLLGCTTGFYDPLYIGADRRIYDSWGEVMVELDWQPRAVEPTLGFVIVGEGGRGGYINPVAGTWHQ